MPDTRNDNNEKGPLHDAILSSAPIPFAHGAHRAVDDPLAQAQTTLSMSSDYEPDTLMGQRAAEIQPGSHGRSDGDLALTLRSDIRSASRLQATSAGVIDIAATLSGALAEEIPFFGISSLPAIAYNLKEANRLYQLAKPRYRELLEDHHRVLLLFRVHGPQATWLIGPSPMVMASKDMPIHACGQQHPADLGADPRVMARGFKPLLEAGGVHGALTSAMGGVSAELYRSVPISRRSTTPCRSISFT